MQVPDLSTHQIMSSNTKFSDGCKDITSPYQIQWVYGGGIGTILRIVSSE